MRKKRLTIVDINNVDDLLKAQEGENIEFKEAKVKYEFDELQQVLVNHSRGQLTVLLRELRAEGRIHVIGINKGARWFTKS